MGADGFRLAKILHRFSQVWRRSLLWWWRN